ncbi:hypothetical protein Q2941_11100 [Bradyrhizobium sp. UFLA05-153]
MELIFSRSIPALDMESLLALEAREAPFRDHDGFLLYLAKELSSSALKEERLLRLEAREALIWLNETPEEQGSFWR